MNRIGTAGTARWTPREEEPGYALVRLLEDRGAAVGTGDLLLNEKREPGRKKDGVAVDGGVIGFPVKTVGRELDDACGRQGIEADQGADDSILQREAAVVEAPSELLIEFETASRKREGSAGFLAGMVTLPVWRRATGQRMKAESPRRRVGCNVSRDRGPTGEGQRA
ncbi:hypothetical protein [Streptomyces coeruleorubidus]|uniref:hypothetical protein n=1 Tax=Streptomyces coeruleorubidus TaxID=116188 RepID=UPI0033A1AADF